MAQGIYNSSQKAHTYRYGTSRHGTFAGHALNYGVFTCKENDADLGFLKVHGNACSTGCEIDKLVEHAVAKAGNGSNTI